MKLLWIVSRFLVLLPIVGAAQTVPSLPVMTPSLTMRPVIGAGGEAALGAGFIGEYAYPVIHRGPTLELALQVGAFRSFVEENSLSRRDYKFRNLLTGIGAKLGTGAKGKLYGKVGIGGAYHLGSESDEYLKESIQAPSGTRDVWIRTDRRYRELVFTGTVEVGVRLTPNWSLSLGGMLITGIGEGNGLLLFGPGLSWCF